MTMQVDSTLSTPADNTVVSKVYSQLQLAIAQGAQYDLLLVDPPWTYVHGHHHGAMSRTRVDARTLGLLPMQSLMANDATLLLWVTSPKLEDAYKLLRTWDMQPTTIAFVVYRGERGAAPGRYTDLSCEFVLLGTKGQARTQLLAKRTDDTPPQLLVLDERELQQLTTTPRRLPNRFWTALSNLFKPALRCAHVFASTTHEGWTCFGDMRKPTRVEAVASTSQLDSPVAPVHDEYDAAEDETPPPQPPPAVPSPAQRAHAAAESPLLVSPPPAPPSPSLARPPAVEMQEQERGVIDVEQEREHHSRRSEQDWKLLEAQRRFVYLIHAEDETSRVALAELIRRSEPPPLPPQLEQKLQELESQNTRQIRSTLAHWQRNGWFELMYARMTWKELDEAATYVQENDYVQDECKHWILRDATTRLWLCDQSSAQIKHLCAEKIAADPRGEQFVEVPTIIFRTGADPHVPADGDHDERNNGSNTSATLLPPSAAEFRTALIRCTHAHIGHRGVRKTLLRLLDTGWHIPCAVAHVRTALADCATCAIRKGQPSRWTPNPQVRASAQQAAGWNDRVHIDLIGPLKRGDGTNCYVVSITDAFTRWPEAAVVADKTAEHIAEVFLNEYVCRYGPPRYLTSDRGAEFTADVLRWTAKLMGVKHLLTTPYHPHSNALDERGHQTFESLIALIQREMERVEWSDKDNKDQSKNWTSLIPLALFAMRTAVHRGTGYTPTRLLFGVEARIPEVLFHSPLIQKLINDGRVTMDTNTPLASKDSERARLLADAKRCATIRTEQVIALWQKLFDKAAAMERGQQQAIPAANMVRNITVGDYVRVFLGDLLPKDASILNPKLEAQRWSSPWRVQAVIRGSALVLTLATDPLQYRVESGLRVKKATLPADLREQYDRAFQETQKEMARHRQEQRDLRASVRWQYEQADRDDGVINVVNKRGRGPSKELLAEWKSGMRTWLSYDKARSIAPEVVTHFEKVRRS